MPPEIRSTVSGVRVVTLGGVRCYLEGRELADLPNQRLRCSLLIYLAVERESTREAVQNIFWSDRDDEKGKAALKHTVYELRRLFGEDCIESQGDRLKIADHIGTDLHDFRQAAQANNWSLALEQYRGA